MRSEAEFALALRQQRLQMRSEMLRAQITQQAGALEAPLAAADQVRAWARWLHAQRAWIAGAVVVVLVVRPRRAWRVAMLGWRLWRVSRRMRAWLAVAGILARSAQARGSSTGAHRSSTSMHRRHFHGQDHRVPAP